MGGQLQGLWLSFYRARRGRGPWLGNNGYQWPWGPAGFDCNQGGT
jgi:hypothetical protein